ncbi:MAG: DNA replication and repair protein RecF [Bacteroidales bacterium]|nr:DNA replication and repair protein RecF [Bacteroidales bacterium]
MSLTLQHLTLLNYRNIATCSIDCSDKINCFVGNNGMGKTNILDAIYHLSFCKSRLNPIDSQNIRYQNDMFMIQGTYLRNEQTENITCGVKAGTKKQISRNKKRYPRFADHIGLIPLVIISPADEALIKDGSDERRKFLDSAISQYDLQYLTALNNYNTALNNRNALLKEEVEPDATVLEIVEMQMEQAATYIYTRRREFIETFTPLFEKYYQTISQNKEEITLNYTSHLAKPVALTEQLKEVYLRDRILGYTTRGSHKDDIEIFINSHPIKHTASQGQSKSTLIAMKMAQFALLKQHCSTTPLFLLDDIFDKLDAQRVARIIEIVSDKEFGQIFITDTNRLHIDQLLQHANCPAKIFQIENGEITPQ